MKSFRTFNRLCLYICTCLLFLASTVKAATGAGHASAGMTVDDILRNASLRAQLANVVIFPFGNPRACSDVKGTLNGSSTASEGIWESAQIFGDPAINPDHLRTILPGVQASAFATTVWPTLPHQGLIAVKSTSDTKKTIVINFADSPDYKTFMDSKPQEKKYNPILKLHEDLSIHRRLTNFFTQLAVDDLKTQIIHSLAVLAAYLESSVLAALTPLLTTDYEYDVVVTGYGIGGALAQIFAPIIFQEIAERHLQAQINLLAFGGPTVYSFHAAQHVRNVLGEKHTGIFATQHRETLKTDPITLNFRTLSSIGGGELVPLFSWAGGEAFSQAEGHNAWAHPVDITYLPSSSEDIHRPVAYGIALSTYTPPEPVIPATVAADMTAVAVAGDGTASAGTSALVSADAPPAAASAGAGLVPAVTGAVSSLLGAPGAVAGYLWDRAPNVRDYVPDVAGRVSQVPGLLISATAYVPSLSGMVPGWAPAWMQPVPAAHPIPSPAFTLTADGFPAPAPEGAAGAAAIPEPPAPAPGRLAAIYGQLSEIDISAMLGSVFMPIIDGGYHLAKAGGQLAVKAYVETKRYWWADCNILFHKALEGDETSFKLLEARSEADHIAKAYTAIALSLGIGAKQNIAIAQRLAAQAVPTLKYWAECGIGDAQIALGQLYEDNLVPSDAPTGSEIPQDTRLWGAQTLYTAAARAGYVEAAYRLGLYHKRNRNMTDATQAFRRAAEKNHPHALNELGLAAMAGQGEFMTLTTDAKKEAEAIPLFQKAAATGLPSAKFNLALRHLDKETTEDKATAKKLLQEAVAANYFLALENLGSLAYEEGDYADAQKHLERAISIITEQVTPRDLCHRFESIKEMQGKAHFKLYFMHRFGHLDTGKADMDKANEHLTAANKLGHPQAHGLSNDVLAYKAQALYPLAVQYHEGKGLPRDIKAAWELAEEVSRTSNIPAKQLAATIRLEMLGEILTPLSATGIAHSEHEIRVHEGRKSFVDFYITEIHGLVDALQKLSRGTELHTKVKADIKKTAQEIYAAHHPKTAAAGADGGGAASAGAGGAAASATAGGAAGTGASGGAAAKA